MSSTENIAGSSYYKKAESQARKIAGNPKKAFSLIEKATTKLENLKLYPQSLTDFKNNMIVFFKMLVAYYQGKYRKIPWSTVIKMLSAIIYFLFVVDFVPDFIPFFGLLDDAAIFAWVIRSIKGDIEKFKEWEREQIIA